MASISKRKTNTLTFFGIFVLSATALSSCQAANTPSDVVNIDDKDRNITSINSNIMPYPSVLGIFACKPDDKAFVAAHRGTDSSSEFPENSMAGLKSLVERGVTFAEVDVARLKDGTMILFHDGVWDKRAVGPNDVMAKPLTATIWEETQKLLMKDSSRKITAERPSKFSDILAYSKDKIYLEIDFKSSTNEAEVISAISDADMLDQVILISYNTEQALRHHKLAPTAALSVGIFKPEDINSLKSAGIPLNVMTAWTGGGPLSQELASILRTNKIPILAASFYDIDAQVKQSGNTNLYTEFAKIPDLVVSDAAFNAQQTLEIKGESLASMEKCLTSVK